MSGGRRALLKGLQQGQGATGGGGGGGEGEGLGLGFSDAAGAVLAVDTPHAAGNLTGIYRCGRRGRGMVGWGGWGGVWGGVQTVAPMP